MEIVDPDKRPEVDLSDLETLKVEKIRGLEDQRFWIMDSYAKKIEVLEAQRNQELKENAEKLSILGVEEDGIIPPPAPSSEGNSRKLSDKQIRIILDRRTVPWEDYTTSELLNLLGINYQTFRRFVKSNGDFIKRFGINKGSYYKIGKEPS